MAVLLDVYEDPFVAAISLSSMIQGMQLAQAYPEWAQAFTQWAEGHVNDSGSAYPKLEDELARAIVAVGAVESVDG